MNCPKCGNGNIVANAYSKHRDYRSVEYYVLFECDECDYYTTSLTEILENYSKKLIDRLKGVLI